MEDNIIREMIINSKRNVSIVVIKNNINEILLVRTKKLPKHWQPIGGGINDGEDAIDAAVRELYEETSLKINRSDLIKIIEVPYDFGIGVVHCYYYNKEIDSDITANEFEIVQYKWFNIKDALELPMFNATKTFLNKLISDNYIS